ncbi:adenylate/guanylate cyclase domain-containing protein [Bradyrhizobium sp. WYCCWR 12699]|uniref:adenylate/guanylate cyclase domain-containing protein n=1 Tax=Bradyrhizobium sp. WYCCWR 12699 TaxID=3064203 RepID=UPI0028A3E002|nr:adenylate/guanylate cyclase domain-containing protein [Bradyrhizobium sp. WYCCWR 12699]MDT4740270.1 adenylate/guanylate cyclase domain-containing protein [Bradyrhizobium sp. WYCCWR 12699]
MAAILAADVAGYSRLMGTDEVGTLAALKAHRREVIDPAIASHRGRIVKTTGDGMLVEFASAVDAVTCAMAVQAKMAERNGSFGTAITLRIGINIGDIIIDSDDIFGDGVNVAARVENECEPGGVCLSGSAYEQVCSKTPFAFDDLGERSLKNIDRPVRLYGVRSAAASAASAKLQAEAVKPLPLPDRPSIAVLPFQNMSGDPEQEYFADGMVEDIITALSRFKSLFVIARNSSFTYKGKSANIKQVGRELGVQYVLEGSVRKAGSRVRITGQLIEATTGSHLWAEKFDGLLDDVFELQDNVATSVVGAIVPQLMLASAELVARKPAEGWDSYDHYLRGLALLHRRTLETNKEAQSEFETAVSLDPNFAVAYVQAAFCLHNRYWNYQHAITDEERRKAVEFASRAIELAPADDGVLGIAAYVIGNFENDVERGVALANRSIALNRNFAMAWSIKGYLLALMGETVDAREALHQAVRFNPLDPMSVVGAIRSHIVTSIALREHDVVASWTRKLLDLNPTDLHGLVTMYGESVRVGDTAEAEKLLARIKELYPHLRKVHLRQMYMRYRKPEHQAAVVERIDLAVGIPE